MPSSNPVSIELMRALPMFAGLSDPQLERLVPIARMEALETNEPLLQQGGLASDVRIIVGGKIRLGLELGAGRQELLLTMTRGEVVGWSALLDHATWLASATALKPTTVLALDGPSLRALCESDHELGYHVMRNLFAAVASRLQDTRLQLLDMYGPP